MPRAFSYMIVIISPTYAQLFLYYIHFAYSVRIIVSVVAFYIKTLSCIALFVLSSACLSVQ